MIAKEGPMPSVQKSSVIERYARHVNPAFIKLLGVLGYGRLFNRARDV
jgi:putrescine aminotransferase